MAIESVSITPGTGKDIAVDTISGKEYQVIKISLGADGAHDTLVDSAQQTMANSVPVVIASDQSAVPISDSSGSLTVDQGTHDNLNLNANLQVANTDASLTNPVPTSDAGPAWTAVYTYTASADMSTAAAISAAPTGGQKIVIDDIFFSTDTAMNFEFEEETSGTVVLKIYVPANFAGQFTPRGKIKLPVADKKLFGDASAAGNVAITVCYHSEA